MHRQGTGTRSSSWRRYRLISVNLVFSRLRRVNDLMIGNHWAFRPVDDHCHVVKQFYRFEDPCAGLNSRSAGGWDSRETSRRSRFMVSSSSAISR